MEFKETIHCNDCDRVIEDRPDAQWEFGKDVCYECLWHRYKTLKDGIPNPEPPRFRVGDKATAMNGQPRIVTRLSWGHSSFRHRNPVAWTWWLRTVHPDDPACIGQGVEYSYRAGWPPSYKPAEVKVDVAP